MKPLMVSFTVVALFPFSSASLRSAEQSSEPKDKVVEGKPIEWGDPSRQTEPPYQLVRVWVDYSEGVTLRVKYKRVATVEKMALSLSGVSGLGVQVYFVQGIKDPNDLPGFRGGPSQQYPSEVREWRKLIWQYIGAELVDKKSRKAQGAFALIFPPEEMRPNADSGELSCPLIGSEKIPFFGEGTAVVSLADFGKIKTGDRLTIRDLSDSMVLTLKLPGKK